MIIRIAESPLSAEIWSRSVDSNLKPNIMEYWFNCQHYSGSYWLQCIFWSRVPRCLVLLKPQWLYLTVFPFVDCGNWIVCGITASGHLESGQARWNVNTLLKAAKSRHQGLLFLDVFGFVVLRIVNGIYMQLCATKIDMITLKACRHAYTKDMLQLIRTHQLVSSHQT